MRPRACTLALCLAGVGIGHAQAAIVQTGGSAVAYTTIPADISNQQWTSRTEIRTWFERQATAPRSIALNHVNRGLVNDGTLLVSGSVPAGTEFQTYMIRFDPGSNNGITRSGSVRFNAPILGVLVREGGLNNSDATLGRPGVSYNRNINRGMEINTNEFFEISADGFQIDFTMVVTNIPTDDIRVMTGVPACIADVDDGSGSGTPDGGVTIDDLLWYLGKFEAGDAAADVDDGSSTGTTDNGVTIDDLLYYLARFAGGC